MSVHQPVGISTSFATSTTSAQSTAIAKKSNALRIVSVGADAHVAIGTFPVGTTTSYYVPSGGTAFLSLGQVSANRVTGITTGSTTTIDFPEGTGSPFKAGDAVTLTVTNQDYFDFEHKIVTSVNSTSGRDGFHSERIVVAHDSSGIATAFVSDNNEAHLRESFKVAARTASGTGTLHVQQIQTTGQS